MLYYIFEFGKTLSICVLLNDYFRRVYTSRYREIGFEILFNVIYVYSFCEMQIKNGIQFIENRHPGIIQFVQQLFKSKPKTIEIEFVKDNKIVYVCSKQQYLNSKEVVDIPDYDFVLYSDTSVTPPNIKIINNSTSDRLLIKPSSIRFMLVEFVVGKKTYKIDLATTKYNFYVKDNILDKKFFLYYLCNIEPDGVVFEDLNLDDVTIKLIDNNVNIHKIYDKQCIKLDENSYEIISNPI